MEKTYCGNSCTECGSREALNCSGCMAGPGKRYGGSCEIAKCCIEKGHEACTTCAHRSACGKTLFSKNAPAERIKKQEQQLQKREALKQQAVFLGEWIDKLFWLVIIVNIISFLDLVPAISAYSGVWIWLDVLGNVLYGLILLRIARVHENFTLAGWIAIIGGIVAKLNTFFPVLATNTSFTFLVLLPMAGFSILGKYLELTAYGEILADTEQSLSANWFALRKWYLICFGVAFGGIVFVIMAPMLGVFVTVAGLIASLVVAIVKILYLRRTSRFFKECQ